MKLPFFAFAGLVACGPAFAADTDELPANQTALRPHNAIARPINPVAAGVQQAPGTGAPLGSNVAPVQNSGTVGQLSDQTRQVNPGRPDPSGLPSVAPTATTGHPQPTALSSLASLPAQIATARVIDSSGTEVGAVQTVNPDADGKPRTVDVALTGSHVVTLDASALGYDASTNTLVTTQPANALKAMPAKS